MTLSTYDVSVPVILRGFGVLSGYVDKAEAYAAEAGVDPSALVGARLFPDMLPFSGQIQRASDNAKNGVARLAGIAAPSFVDGETTFPELRERIAKTVAFLNTATPEQLEGSGERTIELKFRSLTGALDGRTYLLSVLIPNFFFHVATAHGILRHSGVKLGKKDFIGTFPS